MAGRYRRRALLDVGARRLQVQTQAAMLGFNDSWIFILIVFVGVAPSIFLLRRPRRGGPAPEVDAH